jgi:hypothetical protein
MAILNEQILSSRQSRLGKLMAEGVGTAGLCSADRLKLNLNLMFNRKRVNFVTQFLAQFY